MMQQKHIHLFGVCDGHGVNGKEVSAFIKQRSSEIFEEKLRPVLKDLAPARAPDAEAVRSALKTACKQMNTELSKSQIDVKFR